MSCLDGSGHVDTYGVMVAWPLGVGWTLCGDPNTVHTTRSPEARPRRGSAQGCEGWDVPPCRLLGCARCPGGQPPAQRLDHLNGQGVKMAGERRTENHIIDMVSQEGTPGRRRLTKPSSH